MTERAAGCTVYRADWIMPIATPPVADGAVAVVDNRIVFVGPYAHLPADFAAFNVRELGACVLMPGLVNAHTHLELTAMRGFLEGLAFNEWLIVLTKARRDCFDAASLFDSSCAGIEEALRNGTTTCADTTESGVPLHAMQEMGIRGIGYLEVFGPDPAHCATAMAAFTERAVAHRVHDTALVRTGVSPHAPYTVSAPLFRAVADLARAEQWPVAVHVAESMAETRLVRHGDGPFADALRQRGIRVDPLARSPVALLGECGVLHCEPLLIHAIQVDQEDILQMVDHGARVVHCPISNAKLGHGIQPLTRMLDARLSVGLGTDSVASNDRMDILGEARQAVLLQSVLMGTPDAISAHDVLSMATLGGARALGLDARIGTLEVGKDADLCAFAIGAADARPVYDPAVTLVHVMAGAAPAQLVVVAGVERVRDGIVVDADISRRARMTTLGNRLREWRYRYAQRDAGAQASGLPDAPAT